MFRVLATAFALQIPVVLGSAVRPDRPPAPPGRTEQADRIADRIVVRKSNHILTLFSHGAVLRTYRVALGRAPGPKQRQGDNRTPEGHYRIDSHNLHSAAHISLHISYPNPADRAAARAARNLPGGDIMIHGLPNGSGYLGALAMTTDWTYGCIAVTDAEMDEIFRLVPDSTPIDILP